jgi:septum formation protein
MKNRPQLVLASSSKPRKLLLQRLGMPFKVIASNVDETPLLNEPPRDLVLRLAKQKAIALANQFPDALIIGADQVGVLDNTILCKPINYEQAIKQLQFMSGKRVQFLIGLSLLNTKDNTYQAHIETFDIVLKELSLAMIENYLKKEDPLNCAASFKVEGLGISLIEKMIGDDYTALIGLPLVRLIKMLENVGVRVI